MELFEQILWRYLAGQRIEISFPDMGIEPEKIVQMQCYQTLNKIKAIIEDDSLEDKECFMKIEQIICTFEEIGVDGGTRHDFG